MALISSAGANTIGGMIRSSLVFFSFMLLGLPSSPSWGQEGTASERLSQWHGGERHDFICGGRAALLVCPVRPAQGRPWIWRMEFFGHEPQADAALLAKGWHVAYLDMQNLYGAPPALDAMDAFYRRLTAGRGLAPKVVLEGFSRGGLFSLNWAARHPQRVACIYHDAPVCDFRSWPLGFGKGKGSPDDWARLRQAYGLTDEAARAGDMSPIHHLAPLAKAQIPLLHVVGDADEVVPYEENTAIVEQRYRELGGKIEVIHKPGVKHHPHSLVDPTPIVDFILAHFKPEKQDVAADLPTPENHDPALPDVLLIGDSISIGYTPETRALLASKANVWRLPVNGGPTTNGLEFLDDWLAGRTWRVIHFNWGLHDLKHVGPTGTSLVDVDSAGARHLVPIAAYEKNLTALTQRLLATGAKLIWASTTPVPEGAKGRIPGDEQRWNEVAARIMGAAAIPINPLHVRATEAPTLRRPRDVHFTPDGSRHLAEQVASQIAAALAPSVAPSR
jgi:pimeloyl-ACP methyl ester carboxylesterase